MYLKLKQHPVFFILIGRFPKVFQNFKRAPKDDLSRFVLILLRMRMQKFSAGNKNINKGADQ